MNASEPFPTVQDVWTAADAGEIPLGRVAAAAAALRADAASTAAIMARQTPDMQAALWAVSATGALVNRLEALFDDAVPAFEAAHAAIRRLLELEGGARRLANEAHGEAQTFLDAGRLEDADRALAAANEFLTAANEAGELAEYIHAVAADALTDLRGLVDDLKAISRGVRDLIRAADNATIRGMLEEALGLSERAGDLAARIHGLASRRAAGILGGAAATGTVLVGAVLVGALLSRRR